MESRFETNDDNTNATSSVNESEGVEKSDAERKEENLQRDEEGRLLKSIEFIIADRAKGKSGLSIGTHLAMETIFPNKFELFDSEREIPKLNEKLYDTYVINVYTVARNVLGAVEYDNEEEVVNNPEYGYSILNELHILKAIFEEEGKKLYLWYPDYTNVVRSLINGKETKDLIMYVKYYWIESVLDKLKTQLGEICVSSGHKLPKEITGNILLMTNIPADLCNHGNITLIEPHTGAIKTKSDWYTKYHKLGSQDLSNLPMNEVLLYYMGDYVMCPITPIGIRKEILSIASSCNWTFRTTVDKVKSDIKNHSKFAAELLNNIKRVYV